MLTIADLQVLTLTNKNNFFFRTPEGKLTFLTRIEICRIAIIELINRRERENLTNIENNIVNYLAQFHVSKPDVWIALGQLIRLKFLKRTKKKLIAGRYQREFFKSPLH